MRVPRIRLALVAGLGWCWCLCAAGGVSAASDGPTSAAANPLADSALFPIAVWLQDPAQAAKYKAAGVNLYVALWKGPTEAQLKTLRAAGMPVICEQSRVGLSHRDDLIIVGWMHGDEPDNAQEIVDRSTGKRSYGPPVPPARIVAEYQAMRAADPTRPIMLNLGQGVANDDWKGRGPGASLDDYPKYVRGADIVSFDVYPVAGLERSDGDERLWYVARGLDRLARWTGPRQRVWNCIECTHISNPKARATPHQVRAEVWMSLVHGSRGLIYFVHQFQPSFNEHALLDDPEMLAAVTAINGQIRELAPVLNRPQVPGVARVRPSNPEVPIDLTVRQQDGTTYVFAVGMRNAPCRGAFEIRGLPSQAAAEVLGEGRRVHVKEGRFEDDFRAYDVHLYRIGRE